MKQSSPTTQASDRELEADSEPSDTTPLLQGHTTTHGHGPPPDTPTIRHHHKTHPKFFIVLLIVISSIFFVSIGDNMNQAPWMRIQEDIVCRAYYRSTFPNELKYSLDPIPEGWCKVPDVQAKLAMLRGWGHTFSCIPSIFTAVPYGVIADKYGRKIVMFLCLMGICLIVAWAEFVGYFSNFFAIEWFWAGNVFLFIGGGSQVARSTFFTILADVASEDRR